MRLDRRGSWIDTKRELKLIAWTVFLIDCIAIGLVTFADGAIGGGILVWGPILAIYVSTVFALIVAANLAIEYAIHLWHLRHARPRSRRRSA